MLFVANIVRILIIIPFLIVLTIRKAKFKVPTSIWSPIAIPRSLLSLHLVRYQFVYSITQFE